MNTDLKDWNTATADLPYGVQRVFINALEAVKDESIHMVWGSDYRDGKPCLVNAVASMLVTGGGNGIPSQKYGEVVSAFDRVNLGLFEKGINPTKYVSPLASEILLRHFGDLKPEPEIDTSVVELSNGAYIEPSDEEFAQDLMNAMTTPAPDVINEMADNGNPVAQFARDYIHSDSDK